ncbi:MAG: hypothetical protein JOZ82_00945, partial [Marmoricola sp.]|nr:hypothetical protein [Marmoricola sp.]
MDDQNDHPVFGPSRPEDEYGHAAGPESPQQAHEEQTQPISREEYTRTLPPYEPQHPYAPVQAPP